MPQTLTFDVVATVTAPANPLVLVAPPPNGGNPSIIPNGPPGTQYQCVVTGGVPPYSFSAPTIPASWGLTATGLLTRGSVGNYAFSIAVRDSSTP
jgi:hypothetical protein